MDQRLLLVTQSGSVGDLYSLIQTNPCILQNVDVLPFIHTPLHEASSTGKTDLAMELMILKPSFAMKLNEDGFSPLHLAVENNKADLALELVKFDASLVRIRGRGGMTPLHLVAKKGDVHLLTEFLLACPESIRDANVNGETALHIAVMNKKYEELRVLIGWMQRMRGRDASSTETHVLNRRDREGNTALHLAAYENNRKAVKELLKCIKNRNIKNKSGMTALDALRTNGSHMNKDAEKIIQKSGGKTGKSLTKDKTMPGFLRTRVTFREYCSTGLARYRSSMSDGIRNSLLVITALIITATYQTAAQPEDKVEIDDTNNALKILLSKTVLLWGFNTIAFCLSIVLTFILLPVGRAYALGYIFITVPLVFSYGLSVYMKYVLNFKLLPKSFFGKIYMIFILGVLVYVLVFYVRWKRSTQKKVPNPKTELISEGFKTVV